MEFRHGLNGCREDALRGEVGERFRLVAGRELDFSNGRCGGGGVKGDPQRRADAGGPPRESRARIHAATQHAHHAAEDVEQGSTGGFGSHGRRDLDPAAKAGCVGASRDVDAANGSRSRFKAEDNQPLADGYGVRIAAFERLDARGWNSEHGPIPGARPGGEARHSGTQAVSEFDFESAGTIDGLKCGGNAVRSDHKSSGGIHFSPAFVELVDPHKRGAGGLENLIDGGWLRRFGDGCGVLFRGFHSGDFKGVRARGLAVNFDFDGPNAVGQALGQVVNPITIQEFARGIDFDIGGDGEDASIGLFPERAEDVETGRGLPFEVSGEGLVVRKYKAITGFVEEESGSGDHASGAGLGAQQLGFVGRGEGRGKAGENEKGPVHFTTISFGISIWIAAAFALDGRP